MAPSARLNASPADDDRLLSRKMHCCCFGFGTDDRRPRSQRSSSFLHAALRRPSEADRSVSTTRRSRADGRVLGEMAATRRRTHARTRNCDPSPERSLARTRHAPKPAHSSPLAGARKSQGTPTHSCSKRPALTSRRRAAVAGPAARAIRQGSSQLLPDSLHTTDADAPSPRHRPSDRPDGAGASLAAHRWLSQGNDLAASSRQPAP